MTPAEVDSAFSLPQMERRDWSDSFVYVTTLYEYMGHVMFLSGAGNITVRVHINYLFI